jgi:aryl-alcohol dehydrogenase-like predicted oxidoreductase
MTTTLGTHGPTVSSLGLGCMAMSGTYGPADEQESVATIHAALDAGINLLDTGDFYGMGQNELLIRRALADRSEKPLLSVKFGARRGPDGSMLGFDGSPASVKTSLAYSLTRLGTDHVDVYRPARLDPNVPIEETIGAIKEMIEAGYVRYVGLSEVGAQTIRRAAATHPITDLQIEYSVISRGIEDEILPACRELGVAITAYGVLSRGLLGGGYDPNHPDIRSGRFPRFRPENLEHNLKIVRALEQIGDAKGATAAQLAVAWVLHQGSDVHPLAGARNRTQLTGWLEATSLDLTQEDLARIDREIPDAAGTRYDESQMAHLDSERG